MSDWPVIAAQLYGVALIAGCRCEYARNAAGVPTWFEQEGGGIGRRLIRQCSRCAAIALYEEMVRPDTSVGA